MKIFELIVETSLSSETLSLTSIETSTPFFLRA